MTKSEREIVLCEKYESNVGWVETGTVSTSAVARGMSSENFAEVIADFLNSGMKDYRQGLAVGKLCQNKHRTLQASIIRFCLGIIIAISDTEWTDARNEAPVAMGKEIARQIEAGDLNMGYMI